MCIASCRPRAGEALTTEGCVPVKPLVLNLGLASLLLPCKGTSWDLGPSLELSGFAGDN